MDWPLAARLYIEKQVHEFLYGTGLVRKMLAVIDPPALLPPIQTQHFQRAQPVLLAAVSARHRPGRSQVSGVAALRLAHEQLQGERAAEHAGQIVRRLYTPCWLLAVAWTRSRFDVDVTKLTLHNTQGHRVDERGRRIDAPTPSLLELPFVYKALLLRGVKDIKLRWRKDRQYDATDCGMAIIGHWKMPWGTQSHSAKPADVEVVQCEGEPEWREAQLGGGGGT